MHYSTKPIGPQTRFSDHDDLEIFELKYLKKDHQHQKQPKEASKLEVIDEDYEHLDAKLGIKNLDDNYPEFVFQDVPKREIAKKQTFEEYFKDFMQKFVIIFSIANIVTISFLFIQILQLGFSFVKNNKNLLNFCASFQFTMVIL